MSAVNSTSSCDAEGLVEEIDELPSEAMPQKFGRYQLVRRIAAGGMAEVFRAVLRGPGDFEKTVALKRMLPTFDKLSVFRRRFLDEARLAAELNHVNVVQVFDFGEVDGRAFLTMELVDGTDVGRLLFSCRSQGFPLPLPVALFIIAEGARGLAHAHSATRDGKPLGVVHRDVSPQNLLVSRSGEVKIADFGIARATTDAAVRDYRTGTGAVMGKLRFMSPEQVTGLPLDARSDLFALGLLLFELITNVQPISGDNPAAVVEQVKTASFPKPSSIVDGLPPQLDAIVERALAREREGRYTSGTEMSRDLSRVLSQVAPGFGREELAAFVHGVLPAPIKESSASNAAPATAAERQRRSGAARRPPRTPKSGASSAAAQEDKTPAVPPLIPTLRVTSSELVAAEAVRAGINELLREASAAPSSPLAPAAPRPRLEVVPSIDELSPAPLAPSLEPEQGEHTPLPVAISRTMTIMRGGRSTGRLVGVAGLVALVWGGFGIARHETGTQATVVPHVAARATAVQSPPSLPPVATTETTPMTATPVAVVAPPVKAAAPARRAVQLDGKTVVADDGKGALASDADDVARARQAFVHGEALRISGDLHAAESALQSTLSLYPGFASAYRALGQVYAAEGNNELAASSLETFLSAHPAPADAARARRWLRQIAAAEGPTALE